MRGLAHALSCLALTAVTILSAVGVPVLGATAAPAEVSMLAGSSAGLTLLAPGEHAQAVALPAGVDALVNGADGPVVLANPASQPLPGNLGLAALAWSPADGRVSLISVDMSTPLMGSMYTGSGYTEVRSLAGMFGKAPFALMGFFGGGAGYALSVTGDDLLPDPAYQADQGEPLLLEGGDSLDCFPGVLALLGHGRFLLRSAVPSGPGWACRYSLLSPHHGPTLLAAMDRAFPSGRAVAAASACGPELGLVTWTGWLEEGPIGGPWRRVARLGSGADLANEWPYPAGIACSRDGSMVAATVGGKASVWRHTRGRLHLVWTDTLPRRATSWLPLFGVVPRLPGAGTWLRPLGEATAVASRLDVLVPSTGAHVPDVRISLQVARHTVCEPLVPWSSPTAPTPASVDGCPVSARAGWSPLASISMVLADQADAADANPSVVAAVRRDDLLLPAAGWLPLRARLTVRARADGRIIQRVVHLQVAW